MTKINNYIFYLKSKASLPSEIARRVYWWDHALYVQAYEVCGNGYDITLRDVDIDGAKTVYSHFTIPKSDVLGIEEVN